MDALSCFLEAWNAYVGHHAHGLLRRTDAIPEETRAEVRELLDAFRYEMGEGQLIPTLSRASSLLEQIARTIHWDDGFRDSVVAMVTQAVEEAERRFGPGTGGYKRQFVTDVVLATLSRDYLRVPLSTPIESVVEPILGMFISWTVELLNLHLGRTWYGAPTVKPTRRRTFSPSLRTQWRLYVLFLTFSDWITRLLRAPRMYDRRVRRARKALGPQVQALQQVLPRESLFRVGADLGRLILDLGALATPHVRTVDRLVRFARSDRFDLGDRKKRHELLVAVLQELLGEAYSNDPILLALIYSDLGYFLLRDLVSGAEIVLERNGLLPRDASLALPPAAQLG